MDAECGSDVCDADAGTCTASSLILYASSTGSAGSNCDQTNPCTLGHAIALADTTRFLIRLVPGSYAEQALVESKQVTVDGFGSTIAAPVNESAFYVRNGGAIRIVGISISTSSAVGAVECDGGSLALSQITISALGDAVVANPPTGTSSVTIDRSLLKSSSTTLPLILGTTNSTFVIDRSTLNGGDGISTYASTCAVSIQNSIVKNQTASDGALWGIGRVQAAFDTFVDAPLKCTSSGIITIDNSILTNTADAVSGTGATCLVQNSLLSPQNGTVSGSNNRVVDPHLKDLANGDYSLMVGSPAIDTATGAVVPPVDFIGTTRPQGPRADVGAYEFKP